MNDSKDQLMNLADALVEDVLAMSDEEIMAEATPEEIEEAKRARDAALAERPFFECPGCGADLAIIRCSCGSRGPHDGSMNYGPTDVGG